MKTAFLLTLSTLALSACASLGGPSPEEIGRLPVVRYGQPAPAERDFVLLYPAGAQLPITARVTGSLFEKSDETTLNVRLKQDVYLYRDRISFDGKTWDKGNDKVASKFWLALPGDKDGKRDAQSPGELGAEFNLK